MSITPKNWDTFQHYKDRKPAWIKLHHDLLDDYEFAALPVESRALAPLLWLIASEGDSGAIDDDLPKLAFRLRQTVKEVAEALHPLMQAGFFVKTNGEQPAAEKWPSRHVSQALRSEILERDGHKCVHCASEENLEIDHMTPVSKGGESVAENLQTLCRSCNRTKRVKSAEQFATQPKTPRSPEREEETQVQTEKEGERAAVADATSRRADAPRDVRKDLFDGGLKTLATITGKTPDSCRSVVGKWLKSVNDEAIHVLAAIEDAERNRVADPVAWINKTLQSRNTNGQNSVLAASSRLVERINQFNQPAPGELRSGEGGPPVPAIPHRTSQ